MREYREYQAQPPANLKNFPRFKSHAKASCFHCYGDFGPDGYPYKSGYADGRGAYVQACERCGFATWYDINEESK